LARVEDDLNTRWISTAYGCDQNNRFPKPYGRDYARGEDGPEPQLIIVRAYRRSEKKGKNLFDKYMVLTGGFQNVFEKGSIVGFQFKVR
jgi:hypothetical protein